MCSSNFYIPTQIGQGWTFQNWAEDYLSFSSTKRVLHFTDYHEKIVLPGAVFGEMWVSLEKRETTWYGTTLKIISYFTVILPLVALILKCFLIFTKYRVAADLTNNPVDQEKPKITCVSKDKNNPFYPDNIRVLVEVAKKAELESIDNLISFSVDEGVFSAKLVDDKYDARSTVGFQKYGDGFVFFRSERWAMNTQASFPLINRVLSIFVSKDGEITDVQQNGHPLELEDACNPKDARLVRALHRMHDSAISDIQQKEIEGTLQSEQADMLRDFLNCECKRVVDLDFMNSPRLKYP